MAIEQAILTWIHLIAAAIWVGGSIFIGIVFSPILKTITTSTEERIQIMIKVGKRFNKVAIPALIILMITGLYNSHLLLSKPDLLMATSYGQFLTIKIVLVIALIITYAIHVRVIRKDVEDQIMFNQMKNRFHLLPTTTFKPFLIKCDTDKREYEEEYDNAYYRC